MLSAASVIIYFTSPRIQYVSWISSLLRCNKEKATNEGVATLVRFLKLLSHIIGLIGEYQRVLVVSRNSTLRVRPQARNTLVSPINYRTILSHPIIVQRTVVSFNAHVRVTYRKFIVHSHGIPQLVTFTYALIVA